MGLSRRARGCRSRCNTWWNSRSGNKKLISRGVGILRLEKRVPRLLVIKGADEGKQFELTENAVGVGRDASSKIRLHDTEVSRRHAEFRQVDGGYLLVDTGSANGT